MLEARGDTNLTQESIGPQHGGKLGAQHLDRDVAFVLDVSRAEYDRHATFTELARERVALAEIRLQLLQEAGHERSILQMPCAQSRSSSPDASLPGHESVPSCSSRGLGLGVARPDRELPGTYLRPQGTALSVILRAKP